MIAPVPATAQPPEPGFPAPVAAEAPARGRLLAIDAMRGLALVLMVLDHAGFFAHQPIVAETYADRTFHWIGLGWFLVGLITNVSAPTFWMLSGMSIAILAARNRRRDGDDRATARFLIVRAGALLVLEFTLLPLLWASPHHFRPFLEFDLFSSLALSMLVLCVVQGWTTATLVALTAVFFVGYTAYSLLVPFAAQLDLPVWLRPWLVYSQQKWPNVSFPVFGWIGLMTLGYVLGRQLAYSAWRTSRAWALAGLASVAFALALRVAGWADETPWHAGGSPLTFALMSKGPVGLDYLAFNVGVGFLLLAWLWREHARLERGPLHWLVVYGQASLFLFVAHLAVLQITSRVAGQIAHTHAVARYSLAVVLALAALVPAAAWYRGFKERYPRSPLRFL